MRITNLLTSQMQHLHLMRPGRYHYGMKVSHNLAPISQGVLMVAIIIYCLSIFFAPTQAARGTIEHYSAVRVAEQTQTGTSTNWAAVTGNANTGTTASTNGWIDSSNLTAGEDYLVMVWGEHSTNNTAGRSGIRVVRGTTPTVFTESQAIEETDNSGAAFKTPYFWFTVWTAVADEDLEVQFYNDLNTHTAAVEDVTMVVMNAEDLVANSELIYDIDTGGGTNSTTFTMRSSITWTPANANDTWWVGGYIKHDQAGTADQAEGRFDLNAGTIRALHSIEGEDANDTPLYGMGWAQQFAASSQTIEVETREDAAVSGGSEWDATGIFALRLDGFETFKAYGVAGDGTALTANNVYVEQGNVDHQQLSEGNYLVAAGAVVDDNGGTVNSKLTLAGTDITDAVGGYNQNNTDTIPTSLADMQIDSTLGLKDLDFDAQRTATATAELQDRWVVAFSMERASPPAELSMDGYIFENDDGTTTGFQLGSGIEECEEEGEEGGGGGTGQVETTGTVTSFQNGNDTGNQAITVPADADFLVLVVGGWFDDLDNHFNGTVSVDGDNLTFGPRADQDGGENAAAMLYLANPSTGSQTLTWTWTNGDPDEGLTFMIRYLKGVDTADPIRDVGASQGGGGVESTGSMDGQAGDYAIAGMNGYDGTDFDVAWTGATEIFEAFDGDGNSSLAEVTDVTGNVTISTDTQDSGGIVGAVIKPAAVSTSIEATHLTTGTSGTNGTSANTASITPSADKLILASVVTGIEDADPPPVTPTLSGNSLTWVVVHSEPQDNDSRLTVFRAMGASPTSGAVTISTGSESQHAWAWSISEFDNVDTTGTNGSGAIGLVDGMAAEGVTGLTVNLSAFESSTNATYGAFGLHGDTAVTPGTGFTELGEDGVTDAERDLAIQTQWQDIEDTSIDATWTTEDGIAVGLEIRADSGEGGEGGGEICTCQEGGTPISFEAGTTLDSETSGVDEEPITKPAGLVNDDILFTWTSIDNDAPGDLVPPTGFTEITEHNNGGDRVISAGYKIITDAGSEPNSYTWQAANERGVAGMIIVRGVDTSSPILDFDVAAGSPGNRIAPSVDVDAGGAVLHVNSGFNLTGPGDGWVELQDIENSGASSQDGSLFGKTFTAAGTTGAVNYSVNEDFALIAVSFNALGGGGTVDLVPLASADDGTIIDDLNSLDNSTNYSAFGMNWDSDNETEHAFIRFPNATIPQGATITAAYLELEPNGEVGESGPGWPILSKIAAVDTDNYSSTPANYSAGNTERTTSLTTAQVDWDFNNTESTTLTSVSIVSVIQEVVDRGGWASGNGIGIWISDDGTGPDTGLDQALQTFQTFDGSVDPVLHIEFESAGSGGEGCGSTFPNYLDTTETTSTNFGTGNVNYPATVDAGDLLLLTYTGSDTISSVGDGFTLIKQRIHTTSDYSTEAYALVADGSEDSGTVSVTLATSANLALFHMLRIEAGTWGGTIATDIGVSTAAASTGGNPNPDSVTAGWGSDKNLFIAIGGQQDDDDFTSGPSNYTNFTSSEDGVNNSHGTATRELEADSDDPGIFTHPTGTDPWGAMTLVIKPSGGGQEIYPEVLSVGEDTLDTEGDIHPVSMPATVEPGDLILVWEFQSDGNPDLFSDPPTGFTLIGQVDNNTFGSLWGKVAVGNEDGTTVDFDSANTRAAAQIYRIAADTWSGDIGDVEMSAGLFDTVGSPDPDTLTASWGSAKNLWIAYMAAADADDPPTVTGAPTDYGGLVATEIADSDATLATGTREFESDSDDPGAFTVSAFDDGWEAATAVVKPAVDDVGGTEANGDDFGSVEGGTQLAGSEFSSGQVPTGVRQGERMNLRVHLTNSGGTLEDVDELALFYDRGDGIWSKVKRQQPPLISGGSGCDDSAWTCETVVSNNDAGRYNSMAIDRLGHPWVSYRDETSAELKVARYVGGNGSGCALASWSCQTIDSGTDSGEHTSIAVGKESDVWISYWDDNSDDLRVANFVSAGGNCDDLYSGSDAWNCTIVDSTGSVGEYSSVSIDRFGTPWVSYYDATNTRLKVAQYVGSGGTGCATAVWNCTIVENTGVEGQWSSLAFDEDGRPWVSYYHSSSTELKVARFVNGGGTGCSSTSWTCWVVDSDATSGEYSSIAFSPNGTAYVAYYHQTAANLRVANFMGSGGNCDSGSFGGSDAWQCTEVDTNNSVGSNASLAFDPAGAAWIAYRDATNNTLRLARFVGSGGTGCAISAWTCGAVESVTSAANGMSSLAFDRNGLPWISHFDETADNLLVAYLNTRAGEILSAPSQYVVNGSAVTASRADMTSVSDSSNGNSADCIATASWNDGLYFENENGTGLSLPDGLGADQCTEVMWTLDLSQATVGTTYRFIVATNDNFEPDHGMWRGPAVVNEYPTITMDPAEASVYRYAKDNLLQFSNCNTDTAWGCDFVDATDGGGQYTSTGFDPSGNPWISYYETTDDDLKVARYVGEGGSGCSSSTWHCEIIDSTDDTGLYTSLAFDQNGAAWVSYYNATDDDLKVARYVGSNGTGCDSPAWECKVVDSAGNTGQYTSIAFDASGSAWISYYDVSNADLDVTRYVGTAGVGCDEIAWTCSTIESEDDIGSYSSLAFDAKGKPWVSYYDATADDLKVARFTGLGDSSTCGTGSGAAGPPTYQTSAETNTASDPATVNLPSGIQAGDLLIAIAGDGDGTGLSYTAPSGWTQIEDINIANDAGAMIAYRWANGSEGSSVSWDKSSALASEWVVYRISGAANPGTQAPEVGTFATGTSTTPNPPSVTPTGGPKEFLYIALGAMENSTATTAYPSNYTTGQHDVTNGADVNLSTAIRAAFSSSSDNPGTFTFNGNDNWVAQTIAIHPGIGGLGGESNWDCVTVDATDDVGQYSSIAMDASGNPWISYYDNTGGNLEVANFTGGSADCDSVGGGSDDWECTTVDSTDNVGRFTSIGFDATGAAWVSYLDFTNTDLNVARYLNGATSGDCNANTWDCADISSSAGGNNAYTAIAFDLSGTPWISHESTSSNSLNIASLHLPPTKPTSDIIIPFATRSAIKGDARYRLYPGTSPYANPYGTCGATTDNNGYCGLYHPEGYRDEIAASNNERPLYTLATRFSSNTELPTGLAVFQSSITPATENVIMQVYRFGTTNAWETVSTYNSSGCTTTTCTIRAMPSGTPSEYYETDGGEYWVYYRIYQTESTGPLDFQLDHFTAEVPVKALRGGRVFRENITDPLGW